MCFNCKKTLLNKNGRDTLYAAKLSMSKKYGKFLHARIEKVLSEGVQI